MMDCGPTARTLAIGLAITDALRRRGWTAMALAEALGWSNSKVSRIVTGARRAHPDDVIAILAVLGVVGRDRDELVEFARGLGRTNWWQEHGTRPHGQSSVLRRIELAATQITTYSGDMVYPPLQTLGYLRLFVANHTPEGHDEFVADRYEAQQQLLDASLNLVSFIDARALTHGGIPRETMSDQLHHLLRLTVRPDITIRVIPETAAPRRSGSFTLMTFAKHPPLVYLEHLNTSAYLEHPDTVGGYRSHVAYLRNLAMDAETTRTWLLGLADRLGPAMEADDQNRCLEGRPA
ncbi:helix-turn-helix domain-containing protein [Actinophytocola sp.]|uniref:helix-turn-helix domain-containing protein n=1 Tax=Actinophytocola sp. TaxID=1872138 RepID=UPI00389AE0DB